MKTTSVNTLAWWRDLDYNTQEYLKKKYNLKVFGNYNEQHVLDEIDLIYTKETSVQFDEDQVKKAIELARECQYGYDVKKDETYCDFTKTNEEIFSIIKKYSVTGSKDEFTVEVPTDVEEIAKTITFEQRGYSLGGPTEFFAALSKK